MQSMPREAGAAACKVPCARPSVFAPCSCNAGKWAQAEGLNADAIEKLYSDLVQHFIAEELKGWKSAQAQSLA
ncbi:Isochorismate pyruvate-lyase [Pseudomonas chlororaphis]|uniref:Isochorismate pyruvate-lyase n=1 Tax=Pseudomonas chlororaphis TaxID=587753 RepID=A0A3G7TS83_9PSED|nr:Isochorismate pyruvate-lyase [Pseudomonas chlororaphis]